MSRRLAESRPLQVVESETSSAGTIPVVLIDAGWGSSGYYSESVLKNAAKAGVFPEGLQMFLDHPGEQESYDRPERSVRDLAATLSSAGHYEESVKGIVAEAKPMGAHSDVLSDKDFLKAIGLSIRAYGDSTIGEAEGRKGQIITELTEAISVDFVTKAGRGGKVLVDLMESARPEQVVARAVAGGLEEATANDTRDALQDALQGSYGGEKSWAWVRDFDESNVWFQYETPDGTGTYQDSYSLDDQGVAVVGGSPVEVRAKTTYVPVQTTTSAPTETTVPAPAGESTATESEETNMAQIEDTELEQLRESASQRAAAEARASEAERRLAHRDARDTARTIITRESVAQAVTFTPLEVDGLLARVVLGDDNSFDEAGFTTSVQATVKERAEAIPPAKLNGFGMSVDVVNGTSGSDAVKRAESAAAAAFGRQIKEA